MKNLKSSCRTGQTSISRNPEPKSKHPASNPKGFLVRKRRTKPPRSHLRFIHFLAIISSATLEWLPQSGMLHILCKQCPRDIESLLCIPRPSGVHSNIWEKKMCRRLNFTWASRVGEQTTKLWELQSVWSHTHSSTLGQEVKNLWGIHFPEKSSFHLNKFQQSSKQSNFVSNLHGQFKQR